MNNSTAQKNTVTDEMIMNRIYVLRGQKVMVDADLAILYRVDPGRISLLISKNMDRFPHDFMFRLNPEDYRSLKKQDSKIEREQLVSDFPFAFTEMGLAMLSGMFRSARSISVNIRIIRIFTLIRSVIPDYPELSREMAKLTDLFCHIPKKPAD